MFSNQGIPTIYRNIRFRSRLEARWAAFFDAIDWKWEYEPFDLKGYIPDFIIKTAGEPVLVEIKSSINLKELQTHFQKIDKSGWEKEILLLGSSLYLDIGCFQNPTVGFIKEYFTDGFSKKVKSEWFQAQFFDCMNCNRISFASQEGSFRCRINNCYDGDHYLGDICSPRGRLDEDWLRSMWAIAGNIVQWKPK